MNEKYLTGETVVCFNAIMVDMNLRSRDFDKLWDDLSYDTNGARYIPLMLETYGADPNDFTPATYQFLEFIRINVFGGTTEKKSFVLKLRDYI